jgi:NADP-dependent 3-hydroxy acid dehydrogenase YdfG
MLLEKKNAVVYGAGGAIGAAAARAFASDGAKVFLAGRTFVTVQAVASDIFRNGGTAEAARVNALDEKRSSQRQIRGAGRPLTLGGSPWQRGQK